MAQLRIGQMLPASHDLELQDVVQGEKMIYQLFRDKNQGVSYVTYNAQVMAISGGTAILLPFMEEKRLHTSVANSVKANGATPPPARVTSNTP